MSSESAWKDKYLKALESSEEFESRWDRERNQLERMLVRTSLAAEGQDPQLDGLLAQLRGELRKGSPDSGSWQKLQDRIDRQVSALDEQKAETARRIRATLEHLLTALSSHSLFAGDKDRLRGLEKRLRKPETLQLSFTGWLSDFAGILESGLAQSGDQGGRPGVFGRLFGSREPPPAAPVVAASGESVPPARDSTELDQGETEDASQRLRIARRVGDLLGHMLGQVALEPASEARARRLQELLLNSDNWDELREGLNGVAELVIAAVTRSQREFEEFLRRLDERLESLRQCFSDQTAAQAGRLNASEALDREIRNELQTLGAQVESSADFGQLKMSVGRHLQSIGGAVERFRSQESEREKNLSQQLELMHEKLATMEAHAEQVRDELAEERQRALRDVLTQLPNREAWQERLAFEYQRWRRYRHPLTIGVLDIDYFKRVNDSYGHKAGDRVLQLVAKALAERLRTTDFIARFGGEEFVILLPETAPDIAKPVLDNMRKHVASLPFHFRGDPVSVTFSAGLAQFVDGDDDDAVFDRADKALYLAKDSGRDRVIVSGPEPAGG
ncbi:GGDEF domain-containing protein [Marinobacter orientalis]|uniref:diguanylate cyclase n=1 Tax=Marinobacter orientalis TaxID=1928859 RepID=A0A7Y0RBN0_9GAMM|nr:GGDEF domain-containing protein [Marinobacter orientalis]NMT63255.1 diguanylate cyclase [Marinobacter orientalis]TGX51906.1 GGDEF domain-containing protein [Marinobacter orientalis]